MDQGTRRLLGEAANQVFDLAEAMIGVGEKLNEAAGASATASSEGQLRPGCEETLKGRPVERTPASS
jgi:hypothetical protein